MTREIIRPSTLSGIKRLAKTIKQQLSVPHSQALNSAAQQGGWENFRHARDQLKATDVVQQYPLYITTYWHDKEKQQSGRETLKIMLSAPWKDLIRASQIKRIQGISSFKAEAPDHLSCQHAARNQSLARNIVCSAARAIQFVDATKLQPSHAYSQAYSQVRPSQFIPGKDHIKIWFDKATKRYLFTDEPYAASIADKLGDREAWAAQHGFNIAKSKWPGMHAPNAGTELYLISHAQKGIALAPIEVVLKKLPPPVTEKNWTGESAPMLPFFISPGTNKNKKITTQKNKPKQATKEKKPHATVGYVQTFVGPQRRPKGKMPIAIHRQVGQLLQSVHADTHYRRGAHNAIDNVRSELDEWVMREYDSTELSHEALFQLYYGGNFPQNFDRHLPKDIKVKYITDLEQTKKILADHYPNCQPLRGMIKRLDRAILSLQNWR